MKILQFSKNFPKFFFIFLFQKCCLQQSWSWHEKALSMTLALGRSMKAYREKAFFTEAYFLFLDSCKWKIDLEQEVGIKKLLGGIIS